MQKEDNENGGGTTLRKPKNLMMLCQNSVPVSPLHRLSLF